MITAYTGLLALHIVCVLMLAVGDVGALFATARARKYESPLTVLTLMRYHAVIIRGQLIPGAAGSLVTGVALVWVMGISYTAPWIVGTFACWIASLLLGVLLLLPEEQNAIREAQRLVDAGAKDCDDALRRAVGSPRVVWGEWATVVLLLAMTLLMVVKPM